MNNNSLHASLLLTKLNRPQMPHDQVERTRLVEWLNHDIDRPLFLVCAPAGFGKSTLLRRWFSGACAVELRGGRTPTIHAKRSGVAVHRGASLGAFRKSLSLENKIKK